MWHQQNPGNIPNYYRLTSKDLEKLQNRARVLGLEVWGGVNCDDDDDKVVG